MYKYIDGVGKIYYSVLEGETYSACKLLSDDVVEFGVTPNQSSTPIFGSNDEKAKAKGAKTSEVTMTLNGVETSVIEEVLGHIALQGGGYADCGSDAPYIAIQAELTQMDGNMQYLTLFKGQVSDFEIKTSTKTNDTPEVKTITIIGSFSQKAFEGFATPVLKTIVNTTDTGFVVADYVGASAKWGKSIIEPVKKPVTP